MTKTVLVTGASVGLGAAIARRFVKDGHRVIAAARRLDKLDALAKELGANLHPLALDVTDRAAVTRAIESLPEAWSAIDVLVNNAGAAIGLEPAQRANLDDWERMIDVNCKGLVHVTRAVLPGMTARDRGHVINLGSVAATYPYPGGNVYGATKAFVLQFSLNLRADLAGSRVRVTDVEPGMVKDTEFSVVRFKGDEAKVAATYQGFDALVPDDVAECVAWCASMPERVNVNRIEVMSVMQSFAGFSLKRS
jgi:3-hydroxy acid dehydrogenase/malonic semialdehyde reductase